MFKILFTAFFFIISPFSFFFVLANDILPIGQEKNPPLESATDFVFFRIFSRQGKCAIRYIFHYAIPTFCYISLLTLATHASMRAAVWSLSFTSSMAQPTHTPSTTA